MVQLYENLINFSKHSLFILKQKIVSYNKAFKIIEKYELTAKLNSYLNLNI